MNVIAFALQLHQLRFKVRADLYSAEAFPAGARRTLRSRRAQTAGGQDRGIAAPSLQATTPEYLNEFAVCGSRHMASQTDFT